MHLYVLYVQILSLGTSSTEGLWKESGILTVSGKSQRATSLRDEKTQLSHFRKFTVTVNSWGTVTGKMKKMRVGGQ